jgi:magnesium-transporting ATPase (P-type)
LKAADIGLAMGLNGTYVAQAASDIVVLDDKFSSILNAILWGRCINDNIRKFVQFQLTVNIVALLLVFTSAICNFPLPLNAVQMLWVNLIMDTLGALALAIESPSPELLDRRPYVRTANLICNAMWRNILVMSSFQLLVLFVLLFSGSTLLQVPRSTDCVVHHSVHTVKANANVWNFTLGDDDVGGPKSWSSQRQYVEHRVEYAELVRGSGLPANTLTVRTHLNTSDVLLSCSSFSEVCSTSIRHRNVPCLRADHTVQVYADAEHLGNFTLNFGKLDNFEDRCLQCVQTDNTLTTIIFNTFVLLQIVNEFTSRSLYDEVILLKGMDRNPLFLVIVACSLACQFLLVHYGGVFVNTRPLTGVQWAICIAIALLSLPVGVMMRWIRVSDDDNQFVKPLLSPDFTVNPFDEERETVQEKVPVPYIVDADIELAPISKTTGKFSAKLSSS